MDTTVALYELPDEIDGSSDDSVAEERVFLLPTIFTLMRICITWYRPFTVTQIGITRSRLALTPITLWPQSLLLL